MSKVVRKKLEDGIIHTKVYLDDGGLDYEYQMLNYRYHREDGPAYISYHGDGSVACEHYELNDKLHREDGPAFINYHRDGSIVCENYYINNKRYSGEEYKVWLLNKEADEAIHEMLGVQNE